MRTRRFEVKDFHMKALWVALPSLIGVGVTLFAGESLELKVIAYGVLALVAAFGVWATSARTDRKEREREEREWRDALMARLDRGDKADRVLLRNELVRMHREYAEEKGHISLEALEYAQNTYDTYHELGGNGSGTKLWEDIRALPVMR